jgi:chromosome segregation ATPase
MRMPDDHHITNGNTELIEFLNGHFTKIDGQFAKIDGQFAEVDRRFTKIDGQFAEVDRRFAETRGEMREGFGKINERIDNLLTSVDGFVQLHQTLDIELAALRDKYNRVSKAHNELANEHQRLVARVARLEGSPA